MSTRNQNIITHLIQTISATFHTHPLRGLGGFCLLLLCACSDWNDIGTETIPDGSKTTQQEESAGITFSTVVSSARQATRADNTLINKGETMLLPTATTEKKAGLFGCYTGQYTWAELVALSLKSNTTDEEKNILNKYYSANQMYNVPANIESDGSLTYTPLSFWPNNLLPSPATGHEYMTFWAYYPYNETSALGEYGISMTNDELGAGKGMGHVKFVMHPDAAQQNDFLISAPVTDCNRDKYPLQRTADPATYDPKPVQFRLYHMLAQVRFYAYIRGDDKMVYTGNADAKWFDNTWTVNETIMDAYGNVYTKVYANGTDDSEGYAVEQTTQKEAFPDEFSTNLTKTEFLALGLKVPDESKCVRWDRTNGVWDINHARRRANITYTMQLNNIRTSATFGPNYSPSGTTIDVEPATTLGSATVNHYIMNPYWFTFQDGKRIRLNDNYMFGYYEDTPVYNKIDARKGSAALSGYDDYDGLNWTGLTDPLDYITSKTDEEKKEIESISDNAWIDDNDHEKGHKHYNYAPGNILLVVPQELKDEDVPHVIITAKGKTYTNGVESEGSAKVTVNMLKMGISWESGFIYCYAFLDELRPGDDKVRGPESITVLFNKNWHTDQW